MWCVGIHYTLVCEHCSLLSALSLGEEDCIHRPAWIGLNRYQMHSGPCLGIIEVEVT